MVTERAPGPAVDRPQTHPDLAWIEDVRSALDRWAATAPPTPTSSILGSGAVAVAEAAFADLHGGRPALLLPSATYALRVGLQALGVKAGDEVLCAGIDWPSGFAAIVSLGAIPVAVAVDPETLTLDPLAAAAVCGWRSRAVIACHLHGICADVPALRRAVPGLGILEDAAQAFGCRLDGRLAGTLGDVAVVSLGPRKQIDAGEGGVLLCDTAARHERAVAAACHPLRQMLTGIGSTDPSALAIRPHPMTAVLALHRLAEWSPLVPQAAHAETVRRLAGVKSVRPLGDSERHASSHACVPVLLNAADTTAPPGVQWSPSGAQVLPNLTANDRERLTGLLARVRLAACTSPGLAGSWTVHSHPGAANVRRTAGSTGA